MIKVNINLLIFVFVTLFILKVQAIEKITTNDDDILNLKAIDSNQN